MAKTLCTCLYLVKIHSAGSTYGTFSEAFGPILSLSSVHLVLRFFCQPKLITKIKDGSPLLRSVNSSCYLYIKGLNSEK